ncbi:D-alanine--D-alanine ligase family protein [Phreatobacter stygius]|uniref:D-alanine--D-alanine ligase n=1 Tax=Phreatobacter stygius TaxID=1940610 RepID=A0A4D7BPT2_9HYPH|nr:D-alanine--D-alanine ligase family protein [Phreatobacter stygius]QCI69542.1 D-alanine--D-alanine ligase [Phreatobacter stygius]
MTTKLRIAVLFGGRSAEHDVSILSAGNVVKAIDPAAYEVVPIAITRNGRWLLADLQNGELPAAVPERGIEVSLVPGGKGRLVALPPDQPPRELPPVDVLFPVLHGLFGEDGSVQGYAEIADIPFVGCGVLGSACAMDKDIAKGLLRAAGLNVARSVTLRPADSASFADISGALGVPVFIKPARQGSSVGVSKAATAEAFEIALRNAFQHDDKVLVEEFVQGREIECGVLEDGDGALTVSVPGEIVPAESHGFYSYDAKYIDAAGAALCVPAELAETATRQVQDLSRLAFQALGCEGMARVDFFVRPDLSMVVNEINTIPGFTNISMYPKAFAASGIPNSELVDRLIKHGLGRARRRGG